MYGQSTSEKSFHNYGIKESWRKTQAILIIVSSASYLSEAGVLDHYVTSGNVSGQDLTAFQMCIILRTPGICFNQVWQDTQM